jgi:hypothetical protein
MTNEELTFEALHNVKYHQSMARRYRSRETAHRVVVQVLGVLATTLGAVAAANATGGQAFAWTLASTVTAALIPVALGLESTLGYRDAVNLHSMLAQRYWRVFHATRNLPESGTVPAHVASEYQDIGGLEAMQEGAPDSKELSRAYRDTCTALGREAEAVVATH